MSCCTAHPAAIVLLFNEQGEITESTIANVVVDIASKLYTPPVFCGLLPGTLRAHLLQQGELIERPIVLDELLRSPRVFLLNSVRGMYPVKVVQAKDHLSRAFSQAPRITHQTSSPATPH